MKKTKTRSAAANLTRHSKHKSETLMRHAVSKPAKSIKRRVKVVSEVSHSHKHLSRHKSLTHKHRKSPLIVHFNKDALTQPNFSYRPSQIIVPHDSHAIKTIEQPEKPKSQLDVILDKGLTNAHSHLNVQAVENDKAELIYGTLIILVILSAFLFFR